MIPLRVAEYHVLVVVRETVSLGVLSLEQVLEPLAVEIVIIVIGTLEAGQLIQ